MGPCSLADQPASFAKAIVANDAERRHGSAFLAGLTYCLNVESLNAMLLSDVSSTYAAVGLAEGGDQAKKLG